MITRSGRARPLPPHRSVTATTRRTDRPCRRPASWPTPPDAHPGARGTTHTGRSRKPPPEGTGLPLDLEGHASLWGSGSRPGRGTCRDRQPGMIAAVSLRVLYLIVSRLLSWLTLLSRATASRTSSYSSYATRLTYSAEPTRGLAGTGPTERHSLHSSAACPRHYGCPRSPGDSPGRRGAGRTTRDAVTCCPVIAQRSNLVLVEPLTAMGGVGGLPVLSQPHRSPSRDTPVGARQHRCLWRGTGFCHRRGPAAPCIVGRSVTRERGPHPGGVYGVG